MSGEITQGRRIPDCEFAAEPGDYGLVGGEWIVCSPDGCTFMLASPEHPDQAGRRHEVDVHNDGTITVEPKPGNSNSVLSPKGWHGYLTAGVWRSC